MQNNNLIKSILILAATLVSASTVKADAADDILKSMSKGKSTENVVNYVGVEAPRNSKIVVTTDTVGTSDAKFAATIAATDAKFKAAATFNQLGANSKVTKNAEAAAKTAQANADKK